MNRSRFLALLLALAMVLTLGGVAFAEEKAEDAPSTLVYATSTFGQKFSPFFATTAYDMEVVDLTQGLLLAADRGGAIVEHGIEGETRTYNGTDYTYYGLGDVEVVQNEDGTVDYNLTMRDDVVFSDGVPATIDDVIFNIYVLCDPTYDGSSTIYAMPIEGMEDYRSGMESLFSLLAAAGRDNEDFTYWDADTQVAFWADVDQAGEAFAQEIVDYCKGAGYNEAEDSVAACAANWGFELAEDATAADFFANMVEAYGGDLAALSDTETAGSSLYDLMNDYAAYSVGVSTGNGAANIAGVVRTGDYTMTVHMTEFDATAIYNMAFTVAPLHYYGDESLYDYDNNSFGFVKGDLSIVKDKTTLPVGCGAYVFDNYDKGVVTLKANTYYF